MGKKLRPIAFRTERSISGYCEMRLDGRISLEAFRLPRTSRKRKPRWIWRAWAGSPGTAEEATAEIEQGDAPDRAAAVWLAKEHAKLLLARAVARELGAVEGRFPWLHWRTWDPATST